jgi:hypothetical protein
MATRVVTINFDPEKAKSIAERQAEKQKAAIEAVEARRAAFAAVRANEAVDQSVDSPISIDVETELVSQPEAQTE